MLLQVGVFSPLAFASAASTVRSVGRGLASLFGGRGRTTGSLLQYQPTAAQIEAAEALPPSAGYLQTLTALTQPVAQPEPLLRQPPRGSEFYTEYPEPGYFGNVSIAHLVAELLEPEPPPPEPEPEMARAIWGPPPEEEGERIPENLISTTPVFEGEHDRPREGPGPGEPLPFFALLPPHAERDEPVPPEPTSPPIVVPPPGEQPQEDTTVAFGVDLSTILLEGVRQAPAIIGALRTQTAPVMFEGGGALPQATEQQLAGTGLTIGEILRAASAACGRRITRRDVIMAAKHCGLDQASRSMCMPINHVCQIVARGMPRRRRGISAADIRRTRSTIRKVNTIRKSLAPLARRR